VCEAAPMRTPHDVDSTESLVIEAQDAELTRAAK
jgi:hypothetical protein